MTVGRVRFLALVVWPLAFWFGVFVLVAVISSACTLLMPPARFDRGPISIKEYRLPLKAVQRECGTVPGRILISCTFTLAPQSAKVMGVPYLVFVPNHTVYGCTVAQIERHEFAHARGWPANHPV